MWRGAFSASVVLLLALSLLWGECAPCQQLLPPQHKNASGCCDSKGKCKTSPETPLQKPCKAPAAVLAQYIVASPDRTTQADLVPVVTAALSMAPAIEIPAFGSPSPPGYTPPDLFLLHSAFLI